MARRLFLERRTYRRNRLQDAARLLPILGVVLIFAPIFIRDTGAVRAAEGQGLGTWLVYYFVVWVGLILLTAYVSRSLIRVAPDMAPAPEPGSGDGEDGS